MTCYKLSDNVDLQPVDDSMMVLDLSRNAYYSLNETARYFVEKAASGLSFDEIVSCALDDFDDVSMDMLIRDFSAIADEMIELGILVAQCCDAAKL